MPCLAPVWLHANSVPETTVARQAIFPLPLVALPPPPARCRFQPVATEFARARIRVEQPAGAIRFPADCPPPAAAAANEPASRLRHPVLRPTKCRSRGT